MGFAHGELMNATAHQFIDGVWGYLLDQVVCMDMMRSSNDILDVCMMGEISPNLKPN